MHFGSKRKRVLAHRHQPRSREARPSLWLLAAATALLFPSLLHAEPTPSPNRCAFVGFTNLSTFTQCPGASNSETILLSPELTAPIDYNELIVSWNVPAGVHLKAEARALYPDHATAYYILGLWSDDPAHFPRQSVRRQHDPDGLVSQDTLMLSNVARRVQIRLTIGSTGEGSTHANEVGLVTHDGGPGRPALPGQPWVKFLGLSFCNSTVAAPVLEPNRAAWGKVIEVPERRQAEYEGGGGWCSPTSLSMVLAYWSEQLHRPELNHTVPETAHAISDGERADTGNWPFNTAYAGQYPGIRSYVTRLHDVAELEDWIAAGIPVITSVSSYLLSERTSGRDNGHLIVCVGFTDQGDLVVNDPGVSVKRNVRARKTYPRDRFVSAWKKSKNAVYLLYPETAHLPANRLGDW